MVARVTLHACSAHVLAFHESAGASSGIGRATAVQFAKHGVKVAIAGRNAEKLEETAQLCYKEGLKDKDVSGFSHLHACGVFF